MAVLLRGLKNIRTPAGRADARALPYRRFMQITCLEMEKARRNAERVSAAARIREIDARLGEIAAEQKALLAAGTPGSAGAAEPHSRPQAQRPGGGFRVRY